jgi:hypothetical protein
MEERDRLHELTVLQEVTLSYIVFYFVNKLKMPTARHLARVYEISFQAAQIRLHVLKKKGFLDNEKFSPYYPTRKALELFNVKISTCGEVK